MARPRKSAEAKQAAGTLEKSREAIFNLLPRDDEMPVPYSNMTDRQAELFLQVARQLKDTLPLMKCDAYLIQQFAVLAEKSEQAKYDLDTNGILHTTSNGTVQQRPTWKTYMEATKLMSDLATKLGLTPGARIALIGSLTPKAPQHDPTDGL
jgi:P27 family predicted phage terminase small subunit